MNSTAPSRRVIEPGGERRLLAEIARQRHDLDVEARGGQRLRDRKCPVAAAVVDVDDLAAQPARLAQATGDLTEALVQGREAARLVVERHDERQAGLALERGPGRRLRIDGTVR